MKKVLLIGAAFALLVGAVAVGGLVYVGFRVKNRVERVARELSPDQNASRANPGNVTGPRIAGWTEFVKSTIAA